MESNISKHGVQGLGEGVVAASSFRTSYVPLNKQADFINGMQVTDLTAACCATLQAHSVLLCQRDQSREQYAYEETPAMYA